MYRAGGSVDSPAVPQKRPRVPANCDLWLGLQCVDKSEPGVSVWTMTPGSHMENPAGAVQGGLLTALADTAMAAAAVTASEYRMFVANTDLAVSFLRPARTGETLTCRARVIGTGDGVMFVEATITAPDDRLVTRASSTYVLTPRG